MSDFIQGSNISPFYVPKTFGAVTVLDSLSVGGSTSLSDSVSPVTTISATGTANITSGSGSLIIVNSGNATLYLPPVSTVPGFNAKFVVGTAFSTSSTIHQATADSTAEIIGCLVTSNTAGASLATSGSTISLVGNSVSVGDTVNLVSNGSNWYFTAITKKSGGVSLA